MRITAKSKPFKHEGKTYSPQDVQVFVRGYTGHEGGFLPTARAVDTDKGWVEFYILQTGSDRKVLAVEGKLVTKRLKCTYEVRCKETGKVLFSVRK